MPTYVAFGNNFGITLDAEPDEVAEKLASLPAGHFAEFQGATRAEQSGIYSTAEGSATWCALERVRSPLSLHLRSPLVSPTARLISAGGERWPLSSASRVVSHSFLLPLEGSSVGLRLTCIASASSVAFHLSPEGSGTRRGPLGTTAPRCGASVTSRG
jgi:hypothetical protein